MIIFGKLSGIYTFNTDRTTTFNTTATTSKTTSRTTSYTTTFDTSFTTEYYSTVTTYNKGSGDEYYWRQADDVIFVKWSDGTGGTFSGELGEAFGQPVFSSVFDGVFRLWGRGSQQATSGQGPTKVFYTVSMHTFTSRSTSVSTNKLTSRLTNFTTSFSTTASTTRNTTVSTSFYE